MRQTTADAVHWALDPSVRFLNHGSFGACPKEVLARQRALQDQLEAQPVRFFVRELPELVAKARSSLAGLVGSEPAQLAFVPNATTGVNSVLRSLAFRPGDELVTTNHEYHACKNALQYVAERTGARLKIIDLPFEGATPEDIVARISSGISERTTLLLVDHITSPTGLVMPIAEICAAARRHDVPVLVDGAHGVGMVPLDLKTLGASWYTSNCHKWLCTPKGAAFLWTSPEALGVTRPAVISHGADMPTDEQHSRYHLEFDWTGTHDPTPYLVIPEAIAFLNARRSGGLQEVMRENREKVLAGRDHLMGVLGLEKAPAADAMIGSLAALPLPDGEAAPPAPLYTDPLQDRLLFEHGIEVPISPWPQAGARVLRISAHLYVHPADYEALGTALKTELEL